mmetsp:Transcript_106715/g.299891  ORF Transcript_106715/g.299891 Transcript_106715/m.299891 type:complete len:281 (-) Transcript_106715:412-1254(-)
MLGGRRPVGFSDSDWALAAQLVEADGGDPADPSYALIARILKEDRAVTPDADLSALVQALAEEEARNAPNEISLRVTRNHNGGAGFAFDRENLKITSIQGDRRDLATMQVGDVIVAVNGEAVTTTADYNRRARGVRSFRLTLHRANAGAAPHRANAGAAQPRAKAAVARPPRRARAPVQAEREAMMMDIDAMPYEDLLAFEEQQGPVVEPGLKDAAIDRLPVEHVCGGGDECAICLEDFCDGEEIMRLPCLHRFHSSCSRDWLRRQARCPFCNAEVKPLS